ncbi:MAG: CAP domain-containing protein [Firmicutes bacterium]|nr:CAP domain-containing protein [Bacillota bacterium]
MQKSQFAQRVLLLIVTAALLLSFSGCTEILSSISAAYPNSTEASTGATEPEALVSEPETEASEYEYESEVTAATELTEATEAATEPSETTPPATKPVKETTPATEVTTPVTEVTIPATEAATEASEADSYADKIQEVFELVNEERAAADLPALSYNESMQHIADLRAQEITELFSHTRPDGSAWYTAYDFEYTYIGENLAYGYSTAAGVMKGWMNSEGHRANILNEYFNTITISIAEKDGVLYWVQEFSE